MTFTRRGGLAALAAVAASPNVAFAERPTSYDLLGQSAPDFALPKLGGGEVSRADFAGKWLILEFWGLWCPDCIVDMPHLTAFAAEVARDPALGFLAVHSRDRYGRYRSVEQWAEIAKPRYAIALDPPAAVAADYRIRWYPSFVAIDPKGAIRFWRTDLGAEGGAAFLRQIRAAKV